MEAEQAATRLGKYPDGALKGADSGGNLADGCGADSIRSTRLEQTTHRNREASLLYSEACHLQVL